MGYYIFGAGFVAYGVYLQDKKPVLGGLLTSMGIGFLIGAVTADIILAVLHL